MANLGFAVDTSQVLSADATFQKLIATADSVERAQKRLEASTRSAGAGYDSLQNKVRQARTLLEHIDRSIGSSSGGVRRSAADIAAYGSEMDRLRAKYNPLFAASRAYEMELDEINRAHSVGALNAMEHASAIARLDAQYTSAATSANQFTAASMRSRAAGPSTGVMAGATTNMMFQAQDIAMMTAMGQAPAMLAMQQGMQVTGIMSQLGGGRAIAQAVGGAVMSLLNPLNLATIAAIGLGAAGVQALMGMMSATEEASRTLDDHVGWLDEVLRGYEAVSSAVSDFSDEASRLPANLARLSIGDQLQNDTAELERLQDVLGSIRIRDDAFLPLSTLNDDLAVLRNVRSEFESGAIDAETFATRMRLISMNPNVEREVRDLATRFYETAMAVAELEGKIGASETALMGLSDEALVATTRMANLAASFDALESGVFTNTGLQNLLEAPVEAMESIKDMIPEVRTQQEIARELLEDALTSPSETVRDEAQAAYDQLVANTETLENRRKARSSASRTSPVDRWGSSVENFEQRIAQLQLENSLLGETTYEIERQKAAFDLLNQAKQAEMEITPALSAEIDAMAGRYANASEELRRNQAELEYMHGLYDTIGQAGMTAINGIIDALADGKIEAHEFGNILGDVLGMLGQFFLNQAMMSFTSGMKQSNPLGGIMSSFMSFDGGGDTPRGPRVGGLDGKGGFLAMLHPNETVRDNTRASNDNYVNDNRRGGDVHFHINGSGLSEKQMTRAIGGALRDYDASLAAKVEGKVRTMQSDPRAADGAW